jgi:MFS family permease
MAGPARLTSVIPQLPAKVWLLQAGVLINFFGNGLVAPFLLIYLHFGRNIPIAVAGSAIALGGVTAITSGLVAGNLADGIGPRNTLVAGMLSNAGAYAAYTQVHAPWQAFVVGTLVGVGTGTFGPSAQSLLSSMVTAAHRHVAFAQQRLTSVLGLGLGALVGGLLSSSGRIESYVELLLLDAGTFVAFAAILLLLPNSRVPQMTKSLDGYLSVLRDRAFIRLAAVNLTLVTAGLAGMLVLLAPYAKGQAHVPQVAIGAIYAANTLTIVIAQLPIVRLIEGRNRMQMLALGSWGWALAWGLCLGAGLWLRGFEAALLIGLAAVVYALGECLYSAIMVPTVSVLAPDNLRGRYLGALGFTYQGGFMLAPSLGGFVLGSVPLALPVLAAGGCAIAALGTRLVNPILTPGQRATPTRAVA